MGESLISVIIPTYNREKMLVEAVQSVLEQSYRNFEIIVVDDGSTDNTKLSLKQYKDQLTLIHQCNRGPSAARNTGIKAAKGEFLAFLDSDDLWKPDKLKIQKDYIKKHPEILICQTEEIWIRQGRRVNPMKKHKKYSGWIFDKMLPLCIVSPSAVMIHREIFTSVGLFDESLPACEDYDLWLRIGLHHAIALITKPLVIKRGGHADQQSKRFWGMDRFRVQALLKLLEHPDLGEAQERLVRTELSKKSEILSIGCRKHGRLELAEYYRDLAEKYRFS